MTAFLDGPTPVTAGHGADDRFAFGRRTRRDENRPGPVFFRQRPINAGFHHVSGFHDVRAVLRRRKNITAPVHGEKSGLGVDRAQKAGLGKRTRPKVEPDVAFL